jgi:DNA mismatch endonuclease (patch repair protein)
MQLQGRSDTGCELAIRSAVHALGLRYALNARPLPQLRRRADLVFRSAQVAVFVDGCFWHGCKLHGSVPSANREWWIEKIDRNRIRDAETDGRLRRAGWRPVRVWEHADPTRAAARIALLVRARRTRRPSQ